MLTYNEKRVIERTQEVWDDANRRLRIARLPYGVEGWLVDDITMAAADWKRTALYGCPPAGRATLYERDNKAGAFVEFNRRAIAQNPSDMILNTVPHELAHVICFNNGWDMGHGEAWREVVTLLGGSIEPCYKPGVYRLELTKMQRAWYRIKYPFLRGGVMKFQLEEAT